MEECEPILCDMDTVGLRIDPDMCMSTRRKLETIETDSGRARRCRYLWYQWYKPSIVASFHGL